MLVERLFDNYSVVIPELQVGETLSHPVRTVSTTFHTNGIGPNAPDNISRNAGDGIT